MGTSLASIGGCRCRLAPLISVTTPRRDHVSPIHLGKYIISPRMYGRDGVLRLWGRCLCSSHIAGQSLSWGISAPPAGTSGCRGVGMGGQRCASLAGCAPQGYRWRLRLTLLASSVFALSNLDVISFPLTGPSYASIIQYSNIPLYRTPCIGSSR